MKNKLLNLVLGLFIKKHTSKQIEINNIDNWWLKNKPLKPLENEPCLTMIESGKHWFSSIDNITENNDLYSHVNNFTEPVLRSGTTIGPTGTSGSSGLSGVSGTSGLSMSIISGITYSTEPVLRSRYYMDDPQLGYLMGHSEISHYTGTGITNSNSEITDSIKNWTNIMTDPNTMTTQQLMNYNQLITSAIKSINIEYNKSNIESSVDPYGEENWEI